MTPAALDAGVIRQKLDAIEGSLSTLESLGEVTSSRLAEDPVVRAAVERLVSRVVDLSVEVNSHIVAAVSGRGPGDYSESFRMAANAGVFDAEMAGRAGGLGRDAERDRPPLHPARPRDRRRRHPRGHRGVSKLCLRGRRVRGRPGKRQRTGPLSCRGAGRSLSTLEVGEAELASQPGRVDAREPGLLGGPMRSKERSRESRSSRLVGSSAA